MKHQANKKGAKASNRANPVPAVRAFDPLGLAVFFLVFGVFYSITGGDFINYDDDLYVTDNFHVQGGLALEQAGWAFQSFIGGNWNPLVWLSHMLDWQLYGPKPWGHHLTSVLIHAINAALLFAVMKRMTGARWRSLVVALLFGLHPLRVESVAWVSERKDVLSAMFWLLTMWAYARYALHQPNSAQIGSGKNQSRLTSAATIYYSLALVFFVLGLMCKPMVVTLPFVLLLLDYWPLERMAQRPLPALAWEKAPFLLLAAAGSALAFVAQKSQGAVIDYLPFINRVENVPLAYAGYLGKFFCPVNLAILYQHPTTWPLAKVFAATALLLALSTAMFLVRRSRPYCAVGWLWFIGTLVPVIGLIQVGSQSMADRYTYIPGIGLVVILAWGAHDLAGRRPAKKTILATAAAAAIACLALTRHQISFWKDGGTVFRHAMEVTENNFQARKILGDFYRSQGRLDEARELYRQAIAMHPEFEGAHLNLGVTLNQTGHTHEAIEEMKLAIQFKPDDPEAYNDLGAVLGDGHLNESLRLFQKAIELDPDYADAHKNLGQALDLQGRLEEAVPEYQKAASLKPNYETRYLLAVALEKLGRKDEAAIQYAGALKLQPNDAPARQALERLRK